MRVYADSSFLVSYYVEDAHSPQGDLRMAQPLSVVITPLNREEVAHSFDQYVFRGHLTATGGRRA